jgi:hypothetical protein
MYSFEYRKCMRIDSWYLLMFSCLSTKEWADCSEILQELEGGEAGGKGCGEWIDMCERARITPTASSREVLQFMIGGAHDCRRYLLRGWAKADPGDVEECGALTSVKDDLTVVQHEQWQGHAGKESRPGASSSVQHAGVQRMTDERGLTHSH